MNEKEIDYWCDVFERHKQAFQSKDGKRISFCEILKDYKQLQNNWNELKKCLEEVIKDIDKARKLHEKYSLSEERLSSKYFAYSNTLMKMQEMEQGKDERNN